MMQNLYAWVTSWSYAYTMDNKDGCGGEVIASLFCNVAHHSRKVGEPYKPKVVAHMWVWDYRHSYDENTCFFEFKKHKKS